MKDGIGAHGCHIRPTLDLSEETGAIELVAQSDGHPDIITSLGTESLALLAILYFLRALCLYFGITQSTSFITHHFDNQEAIRRLNEIEDFAQKANPTTTDYNVWAAMKEATEGQSGTHTGQHVKGYQRITKENPVLLPEAIMNNRMDEIAGTCRAETSPPFKLQRIKGTTSALA